MYSPIVLDHFGNPRNVGPLARYQARGVAGTPEAGPFMILYLDIQEGRIVNAAFQTYGCGPAIASGSMLTELIKGKSVDEARSLDSSALLHSLGGLPLGKEHCAAIAISALSDALRSIS